MKTRKEIAIKTIKKNILKYKNPMEKSKIRLKCKTVNVVAWIGAPFFYFFRETYLQFEHLLQENNFIKDKEAKNKIKARRK